MKILKKGGILVLSALLVTGLQAQKASVETASLSLRTYNKKSEKKEIRIHSLNEAKKHVDLAVKNPSTANDPKMWLMRARTYLLIQMDTLGEGHKSCIPLEDAIEVAAEAIINCHKADAKKKYSRSSDSYTAFVNIANSARYIADVAYNKKEYDRSIKYYKLIRKMIPYDDQDLLKRSNITNDGLLFNVATTQKLAGDYENAKKSLTKLIDRSYNDPWIYLLLYEIYIDIDKDTNSAIETIDKGRTMFEEDPNLRQQQIFIYSRAGRSQELIKILDDNIEADPYNGNNYYLRGILYGHIGETDKAEEDYLKAVEYNDELLAAFEDLGKLYYNKGAELSAEANKLGLSETDKYNALNAQVKENFTKAIPNFERIYEISTDSKKQTEMANILLSMYLKTEQMDKYKALKAELQ